MSGSMALRMPELSETVFVAVLMLYLEAKPCLTWRLLRLKIARHVF